MVIDSIICKSGDIITDVTNNKFLSNLDTKFKIVSQKLRRIWIKNKNSKIDCYMY